MTRRHLVLHTAAAGAMMLAAIYGLRAIGDIPAHHDVMPRSTRNLDHQSTPASTIDIAEVQRALVTPRMTGLPADKEPATPPAVPDLALVALLRQGSQITGVLASSPTLGSSTRLSQGDRFGPWELITIASDGLVWRQGAVEHAMTLDGAWKPSEARP
jgi:hypothetical protein